MRDRQYGQECKMPKVDNSGFHQGLCLQNPHCYFKQSVRKDERIRELEQKLSDAIKLAKQNADSNEYCLQELEKENEDLKQKLEYKTTLLKDAQKAIERLTIKLQSPIKLNPCDPREPLFKKLSQIAAHCKTVQNRHSKGNDYMFASEILKILAQGE